MTSKTRKPTRVSSTSKGTAKPPAKPAATKVAATKVAATKAAATKAAATKPSATKGAAAKPSAAKPSAMKASAAKTPVAKSPSAKAFARPASRRAAPSPQAPSAPLAPSALKVPKKPAALATSQAAASDKASSPEVAKGRPASRRTPAITPPRAAENAPAKPAALSEAPTLWAPADVSSSADQAPLESAAGVLDKLLREIGADVDASSRARASSLLQELASRLARPSLGPDSEDDEEAVSFDSRESQYAERQWGRAGLRERSEDADDFGADPAFEARVRPLLEQLYRHYFRVTTRGLENVPREGRTLFVSNHSGTFPWDGLMLKMAISLEGGEPSRELRWLVEDFIFHMPFIGVLLNRLGAVRACQENAERLLYENRLTAVFPEGIQGMGKLWNQRYQLQRFGRGGYVKLAMRTRARIVPVAIVGAEETNPLLFKLSALGKPLGMPFIPITPFFPLFGPLGLAPLPSKWSITFGDPIELDEFGPEAAGDAIVVNRLNERVRSTVQGLVDEAVASRPSALF
jgi:1-acyl-sn-glycerol-3-phosphate acyltransferase